MAKQVDNTNEVGTPNREMGHVDRLVMPRAVEVEFDCPFCQQCLGETVEALSEPDGRWTGWCIACGESFEVQKI